MSEKKRITTETKPLLICEDLSGQSIIHRTLGKVKFMLSRKAKKEVLKEELEGLLQTIDQPGEVFLESVSHLTSRQRSHLIERSLVLHEAPEWPDEQLVNYYRKIYRACLRTPYSDEFLQKQANKLELKIMEEGVSEGYLYKSFTLQALGLEEDYFRTGRVVAGENVRDYLNGHQKMAKIWDHICSRIATIEWDNKNKNLVNGEFLDFRSRLTMGSRFDPDLQVYFGLPEAMGGWPLGLRTRLKFLGIIQKGMIDEGRTSSSDGLPCLGNVTVYPGRSYRAFPKGIHEQYALYLGIKGVVYLLKPSDPAHCVSREILSVAAQEYSPLVYQTQAA